MSFQAAEKFLPKKVSIDDVKSWIKENIDFSKFKNKMQSMKPIMDEFSGRIDGRIVKDLIQSM